MTQYSYDDLNDHVALYIKENVSYYNELSPALQAWLFSSIKNIHLAHRNYS